MYISRVKLKNWMNFTDAEVTLNRRAFLVGPNASGKSNFLDAIRFIRDLAGSDGSLGRALSRRGDITRIRSLAARRYPDVELTFDLSENGPDRPIWTYVLAFRKQKGGANRTVISRETVIHNGKRILDRPDADDAKDDMRLTQTHLEQITANQEFRPIADFFNELRYIHLIPQIIRQPDVFFSGKAGSDEEAFGFRFLESIARTNKKTREFRLRKIETALRYAVPQLRNLALEKDDYGVPHLEAIYEHWRDNNAGRQREAQFSDGTIRLIGLLWSILDTNALLLLEEPELSLHPGIVRHLAPMMYRIGRQARVKPQVLVSTHSPDLLADTGIAAEEIVLFQPSSEGTKLMLASQIDEVRTLLESGLAAGEVVIPRSAPKDSWQLEMFS